MPLDFRTAKLEVVRSEGTPPGTKAKTDVKFKSDVFYADVAIKGFKLDFQPEPAAEMNIVQVNANVTEISSNEVTVEVTARYSDKHSTALYTGNFEVLVIAEVKNAPAHSP
jgi:hypothetical protein